MTDAEQREIIRRYVDREITAEEAADDIGPGTAVGDVILAAKQLFGRLPDQHDAFTEGEYRPPRPEAARARRTALTARVSSSSG